MGEKVLEVRWSLNAEKALEIIFDFYAPKSVNAAVNILSEIVTVAEGIEYTEQYQVDEIDSRYRRMVVSHFKIYYSVKNGTVKIIDIIDTRQSPDILKSK